MHDIINKQNIIRNFSKASMQYKLHSHVQKIVSSKLVSRVDVEYYDSILDIGSGTGSLSSQLKYPNMYNFDISHNMCRIANHNSICGDMDNLPFKRESFDHIISSMALQWSDNLHDSLTKIISLAKKHVYLSIPIHGSLEEINKCYSNISLKSNLNNFPKKQELQKILIEYNVNLFQYSINFKYESFTHLLKSIKNIGAHTPKNINSFLSKSSLEILNKIFYTQYQNCATWKILEIIVKK